MQFCILSLEALQLTQHISTDSTKAEHVDKAAQLAVVEEQFKELLNRYKGGIAISSLEDIYEMHFERSLPLKDQSCRSAADLICKIADTLDLSNGKLLETGFVSEIFS